VVALADVGGDPFCVPSSGAIGIRQNRDGRFGENHVKQFFRPTPSPAGARRSAGSDQPKIDEPVGGLFAFDEKHDGRAAQPMPAVQAG
jgi:hypothetical protein